MAVKNLNKIRKDIERIDEVILTALAERMDLMPDLAKIKKQRKIPIFQEKQEQQTVKRLRRMAKEQELDPDFVEEIFVSIFNESKRLQNEAMRREE